jgi:hypothetical protein
VNKYAHGYPHGVGHRGVDTSVAAAASITTVSGPIRRKVYFAIGEVGERGLTSYELAERLQIEHGTAQPRTSELRRLGLIRDSGVRRLNSHGRNAIVWVAVHKEEAAHG